MKKRNNACPICFLKQLFTRPKRVTEFLTEKPYGNGMAKTPPMGWSSWNTFKNEINEKVILETARAMKESGLLDAGYEFVNIDDCWMSSSRDQNGDWQTDFITFPSGIPYLVENINALGLKCGLYSSNGTLTCEDLPASLGREERDARRLAEWGIEYFKYDFCHNIPLPGEGPVVAQIAIGKEGVGLLYTVSSKKAILEGDAVLFKDEKMPSGCFVSGLDRNCGAMTFNDLTVDEDGEYILNVTVKKGGRYEKYAVAVINGGDYVEISFPPTKGWNNYAKVQVKINLKKGKNSIRLFNPIQTRADSAAIQYQRMGKCLMNSTKKVAIDTKNPEKVITFSLCEWGKNQPYKWGYTAGNLWRTTIDIRPNWFFIKNLYRQNVRLYAYGKPGGWNDPDMLEVGNGKLTFDQSKTHFSLWCMMAAPLILGNDVRKFVAADGVDERDAAILKLVKNKELIAIDKDPLGKSAKLLKKGYCDVLARPLSGGRTALCLANMGKRVRTAKVSLSLLNKDEYVRLDKRDSYELTEQFSGEKLTVNDVLKIQLKPFESRVYVL